MTKIKGKEEIIKNAWRKTGYEWFPKEVDEITEAAVMFTEEDEEIAGVLEEHLEEQELPHYIF
jgi:hypothetical protein